jgi:hypothetical protein
VRQHDGIEIGDRKRKDVVLCVGFTSASLKHSAVQSHGVPIHAKQVA